MHQLINLVQSSDIFGLILLGVSLLVFFLATGWILYARKERSLSSILIGPFMLLPIIISWIGQNIATKEAIWAITEATPEMKQTLLAKAISSVISLQFLPVLFVPFLLLLLMISVIISIRFGGRHWRYCIPQLAITGLSVIVLMVNMALNLYMQQGFLLAALLVLGGLGALSQTSSKQEHGTAELAFMSSIIVCIGTLFCVLSLISWNYVILFEAIAWASPEHKSTMMSAGLEYVSKDAPFMLIIVGLSYIPLVSTSLQLTGIRSKASWIAIILIICVTMGFMLNANLAPFISDYLIEPAQQ